MVRIIAVRHGQTDANVNGVLAGRLPGVELTEQGRSDVRALGSRFPVASAEMLAHSTVDRCAVTARLLAASVQIAQAAADPAFDEVDYGQWSGLKLSELRERPEWETVLRQPSQVIFPGGESLAAAAERAVRGALTIVARLQPQETKDHTPVAIIVSHGDIIKALIADALGLALDDFQRLAVAPGSYSIVDYPKDGHPTLSAMSVTASGAVASGTALGGGDAQPV